jgi:hypothetical protein
MNGLSHQRPALMITDQKSFRITPRLNLDLRKIWRLIQWASQGNIRMPAYGKLLKLAGTGNQI